MVFGVLFSIRLVFLRQFQNFGRAKSYVIAQWVVNPVKSLPDSNNILSTEKACLILAEQCFSPSTAEIYLRKQVSNVKDAYALPFKVTVQNKLRSFQFKTIHN